MHHHGCGGDGDIGHRILLCLMKLGLSHIEIRSFLKVGGHCCSRVYNISSNREKVEQPRKHTLNAYSLAEFRAFIDGLDEEDSFPCAHRRPKFYILGEKLTCKKDIPTLRRSN